MDFWLPAACGGAALGAKIGWSSSSPPPPVFYPKLAFFAVTVLLSGAGERFSTWCQLINLVPTILEFWQNLALSSPSYMN